MVSVLIISSTQKPQNDQKKPKEIENSQPKNQENDADDFNDDAFENVQLELADANKKMKELEDRIKELEAVKSTIYKPVKFQNYQNRKRILVRTFIREQTKFFG